MTQALSLRIAAMTGNRVVAEAMRQVNPDLVAAYPITPQTEAVEYFAQMVADGRVLTEFIPVESEHSSMSACIGAAVSGARAMTTTSSQGLALMWEMLYIASSLRLPIVMYVGNRALNSPLNIHCDHTDSMGARDAGWIQIYSEDCQELYHNIIMAVPIAERALLPVMICADGFTLTHTMERVELLPDEVVRQFVGEGDLHTFPYPLLDLDHPVMLGPNALPDYLTEHRYSLHVAVEAAPEIVRQVEEEFAALTGRTYGSLEAYRLEDADYGAVVLGSSVTNLKAAVDSLREEGFKVGVLKLRLFRPFPAQEVAQALAPLKGVAVFDRADSMDGAGGPLYKDICTALFDLPRRPFLHDFIYSLGGRDLFVEDATRALERIRALVEKREGRQAVSEYLQVRE